MLLGRHPYVSAAAGEPKASLHRHEEGPTKIPEKGGSHWHILVKRALVGNYWGSSLYIPHITWPGAPHQT